jgi:hypothetical protein
MLAVAAFALAAPGPRAASADGATDLRQKLLALEGRIVSVDFQEQSLAQVLGYFSTASGVNLLLSPVVTAERDEDDLRITLRLTEVSVRTALDICLELKQLSLVYRSGILFVTTPKDARGKPVLRIYPIGDLQLRPAGSEWEQSPFGGEEEGKEHAFADPDFIMDLITQNTGADSWEDDGVRYSVNERYLFVRQYPSVHREIADLLELLRGYR